MFLKVARFVHVAKEPLDGDRADGLAKEDFFDRVGVDGSEGGEEEEELAEPKWLRRIGGANVF